ncbi:MAG TPA: hypothetical protein VHQ64_14490 [Pyrinomonadaceae bacterium]|jgi:hypothetical protein|nr:hypothetical protein [Pyrinomonadaceae bacterium]
MLFKRALTLILAVLVGGFGCNVAAQNPCNKCYKYQPPFPGVNGATNGRRNINVTIDPSWGATTNSNIWNGVNGCEGCTGPNAIKLWNDVSTPYYFRLSQDPTQANHATDILIRKGNPNLGNSIYQPVKSYACSALAWDANKVSVREIILPPEAANWSQERIACAVAHEMAHGIGLSDVYDPNCVSIMNQAKNGCTECETNTIQPKDVDRVNQQAANPNGCTDTSGAPSHQVDVPTPTPVINNNGGNGGCQSYFDTLEIYDDSGGGNCRYTYAVFTTYCGGYLNDYSIDLMYVENCNYDY